MRAPEPLAAGDHVSAAEHKQTALRALSRMRNSDALRARKAFHGMSAEQMGQEYGQSGQTRAEILAGYEEHEAEVQGAIDWLTRIEVTT